MDAERNERVRCKDEEKERERKNFEYLQSVRREGWRKVGCGTGRGPGATPAGMGLLSLFIAGCYSLYSICSHFF